MIWLRLSGLARLDYTFFIAFTLESAVTNHPSAAQAAVAETSGLLCVKWMEEENWVDISE